jgi:IS5 family transposase
MVGLLLLKQLENLSDERVVLQFKRNPYYQYFCGYSNYMPGMPCNARYFRKSWLICLWLLLVLLL